MTSGNLAIDGLLASAERSLARNLQPGTPVEITYSFLEQAPTDGAYGWGGVFDFQPLAQSERTAVESALQEFSKAAGVSFRYVEQDGLLRYGTYSGRDGLWMAGDGEALFNGWHSGRGADVWLNHESEKIAGLDSGFGRFLLLHETGHALGLKHPGAYSGFDEGPFLPADLDNVSNTVLSYNGGIRQDLGSLDIQALQYLYGLPGSKPAPNTVKVDSSAPHQRVDGSYFDDVFNIRVAEIDDGVLNFTGGPGDDLLALSLAGGGPNGWVRYSGGEGVDQLRLDTTSAQSRLDLSGEDVASLQASLNGTAISVTLDGVERIRFSDTALALDIDGHAGEVYRLYQAAFARTPDKEGLGFWFEQRDAGADLLSIADQFLYSAEFQQRYGTDPSSADFVGALYQNVLGRPAESSGFDFWVETLDSGRISREQVLASFSESAENKANLIEVIGQAIEYVPMG